MKTKNVNTPFSKNLFKFYLLVPVVIMLLALIIGVIFGVNKSNDFKTTYSFTVKYNSTVSEKEYDAYIKDISNILDKNGAEKFDYKFEKLNDDISLTTKVIISNSQYASADLANKFTTISNNIKQVVNEKIGGGHIEISELSEISGQSFTKEILKTLLAVGVITVLAFAYIWIRYELKMALCSLLILPYNVGLLIAMLVLLRLPFNNMFMIPFYLTMLVSYVVFIIIANNIRDELDDDVFAESKNNDLFINSLNTSKNALTIILICLATAILISMLSFSIKVIFIAIACLLGLCIAVYSPLFVTFGLWTKVYNIDKDKRLKAKKLKKENKNKKDKKEKSN